MGIYISLRYMVIKTHQTLHLTWDLLLGRGRRMENIALGKDFLLYILYTVRILYQVHITI